MPLDRFWWGLGWGYPSFGGEVVLLAFWACYWLGLTIPAGWGSWLGMPPFSRLKFSLLHILGGFPAQLDLYVPVLFYLLVAGGVVLFG
jgi:hypothetical protein